MKNDLILKLKEYDQDELFLWTQVVSIHPNNQLYQYRFELLCTIILSIKSDTFKNKTISRDSFQEIINIFNQKYEKDFIMLEDWSPYPIFKSIPLIIDKKEYYFFAGPFENSYEQYQKYIKYFLESSLKEELKQINSKFMDSLSLQTKLIKKISAKEESKKEKDYIYIPSNDFFDDIKQLFITEEDDVFLSIDDFNENIEEVKNQIVESKLHKKAKIKLNEKYYWIFPQEHLTSFYELINKTITHKDLVEITKIFKKQLLFKSPEFFSKSEFEINILDNEKKPLLRNIDFCACVDYNKLFLIKTTNVLKDRDLSSEIKNATNSLELLERDINEHGEFLLINKGLIPLKELDLEIIKIIVHENTLGEYYASIPDIKGNNLIISFSDYLALLDTFKSSLDLFRFVRDDTELRDKIHTADFLDRIPYYLKNNLSYPISSDQINSLIIPPHEWLDYYYDKLYETYVTNRKAKIELLYGKNFNKIKKVSKNIYEFIDTFSYSGGALIENSFFDDIIIQYPSEIKNLSSESIESFSNFLGPLIYTNLEKMSKEIKEVITQNYCNDKYIISLYPVELIKKNQKFRFLKDYLDKIDENNPIFLKTGIISGNVLKTCIIYDFNYFPKLFTSDNNEGERVIIKLYLDNLFHYFNIPNSNNTIISLIDKFIPFSKKGFSYNSIPVINKKLNDYSYSIKDIKSDIMRVNRELTQFIKKEEIKPGIYENEDANKINGKIFDYLKSRIEEYISNLSFENIFFIYNQIELCEGERTRHNLRLKIDSKKYIEYDLKEQDMKKTNEIGTVSMSSKLILSHFLKLNPKGEKRLTLTDWTYLVALIVVHQDSSLIIDYIKHNIQENKIEITDLFELKDIKGDCSFRIQSFLENESERRISDSSDEFNLKNIFESNIDSINEAFFKLLGFSFDDILNFLMILGNSNIPNKYFPMTLINSDDFVKYVYDKDKELTTEKTDKLINFLSLSYDDLKDINLMPLTLSNHLKRTTLCPLVLIDNKILFGNELCIKSALFWTTKISNGILPYNDDNSEIENTLKKYYGKIDNFLENKAIEKSKEILGEERVIPNLNKYKTIGINKSGNLDNEGGEIDILAINKPKKIIFVLDAKHTIKDLKPHGNFKEFKKFFLSKKSYLSKLDKKLSFVEKYKESILNHFKIEDKENWITKKGFVVNTHIPSFHYVKNEVDFILIDELGDYLNKI